MSIAEEEDDIGGWRNMSKSDGEEDDVDFGAVMKQAAGSHDATAEDVLSLIDRVLQYADQARGANMKQERA